MDMLVAIIENQDQVKHLRCTLTEVGWEMVHGGPSHETRQFTAVDLEVATDEMLGDAMQCFVNPDFGGSLERLSLGCSGKTTSLQRGLKSLADYSQYGYKQTTLKELGLRDFDLLDSSHLLFGFLDLQNLCRLTLFRCSNAQSFLNDIGQ